jgi:hypothetical protein
MYVISKLLFWGNAELDDATILSIDNLSFPHSFIQLVKADMSLNLF